MRQVWMACLTVFGSSGLPGAAVQVLQGKQADLSANKLPNAALLAALVGPHGQSELSSQRKWQAGASQRPDRLAIANTSCGDQDSKI